ncbi:hypothetical protein [Palleronia rufa]|uniref:hypothetical protein n=1 Tax=Palleronia rufa TaxID=1530186 RepID=UPI0005660B33|nr:hypothetical protein [Palleronia rufa]
MSRKGHKPTPSTRTFAAWIEDHVRPLLIANFSRPQVSVLIDLLRFLEQQRYDFSADRAFQTRPLSNARIADALAVTDRTVRRWLAHLERLGLVERVHRKNPHHRYKNLLNRVRFSAFWGWFRERLAKAPVAQCPPSKKDMNHISLERKKSCEEPHSVPSFPNGTIRYDAHWRDLAEKHLPSGRCRPDINVIAQRFRENLRSHAIGLDHSSITARWIAFCKRARPV